MGYYYGFIGCGNMGGAFLNAVARRNTKDNIAVYDIDTEKSKQFENKATVFTESPLLLAQASTFIVLAVKPKLVKKVLEQISPILKERKSEFVLVSMAAGVAVSDIQKWSGVDCGVIRIMPNMPVSVGVGVIGLCRNTKVTDKFLDAFKSGASYAGMYEDVDESLIDAVSALSGSGPAFVAMFAEAMADAGVLCGLSREQATTIATMTLKGTAEMISKNEASPADIKNAVCSPGGSTIEGVMALENGNFRGTVMNAVKAAYDKNSKLKK